MGILENVTDWLQNLHKEEDMSLAQAKTPDFPQKSSKGIQYKPKNGNKNMLNRCKHNPNSACACCSTLNLIPRRTMTYPPVYIFVCSECKQSFSFTQNDKGEFVPYSLET